MQKYSIFIINMFGLLSRFTSKYFHCFQLYYGIVWSVGFCDFVCIQTLTSVRISRVIIAVSTLTDRTDAPASVVTQTSDMAGA